MMFGISAVIAPVLNGKIGRAAGLTMISSYLLFTAAQYGGPAEAIAGSVFP
jgi:hypothetical protein